MNGEKFWNSFIKSEQLPLPSHGINRQRFSFSTCRKEYAYVPYPVPRKLSYAIGLAAIVALSSAALASDLADISMEVDGWTMVAITDVGLTTHIIATRDDDEALTTDIDVVLYEKTAIGWDGTAYDPHVTKEDALIDLATEFGLPDPQLGDWLIQFDQIDVLGYVLPRVGFGKGFFVTDPLYVIANQLPNPQPLAQGAEGAGLPAGGSVVNTGSVSGGNIGNPQPTDCSCDACIQAGFADLVDLRLSDPTIPIVDLYAIIAFDYCLPCYSKITVPGTASTWSSWSCSAWGSGTNNGNGTCSFTTTSSKLRSRTMTTTCHSCISGNTTRTWTQFQTQSGSVTVVNAANSDGSCNPPTTCPAPTGTSPGRWTPPGPACPFP